VAVGLSGGVDSARRGAPVNLRPRPVALTIQTWDGSWPYRTADVRFRPGEGRDSRPRARWPGVWASPITRCPAKEFGAAVLDHFRDEYRHGRTPNPASGEPGLKFRLLPREPARRRVRFRALRHRALRPPRARRGRRFLLLRRATAQGQSYFWRGSPRSSSRTGPPLGTMPSLR